MPGDMTENNCQFIVGQKTLVSGSSECPWRDLRSRSVGRDSAQCMVQGVRRLIGQHSMLVKQLTDGVHALTAAADDSTLPPRSPTRRTLRFAGFVDQRGVETPNAGGNDVSCSLAYLNDPPSAGRYTKIDSKNTPGNRTTHHST